MDLYLKAALFLTVLGVLSTVAYLLLTKGILWGKKKR